MSTSSTEAGEGSLEIGGERIQEHSSCHPTSEAEDDLDAKAGECQAKFEAFCTPPCEFQYAGVQADPAYGESSIYIVAARNPGNVANRARVWQLHYNKQQLGNEGWVWHEIDDIPLDAQEEIDEALFGEISYWLREKREERRADERRRAEEEEDERQAEEAENRQRQATASDKTVGEEVAEGESNSNSRQSGWNSSNARAWERGSE